MAETVQHSPSPQPPPDPSAGNRPRVVGRPEVWINMAISADGKIASADHQIHTFGSTRDQACLYRLRTQVDALLCGANTVVVTDASLGIRRAADRRRRRDQGLAGEPLRVVVSQSGNLPENLSLWSSGSAPLIVAVPRTLPVATQRALSGRGAQVWAGLDEPMVLSPLLEWLHTVHGVGRLLCEGGGRINDALFREGTVDRLHLTRCPLILGGDQAPTLCDGPGFPDLQTAARFRLHRVLQSGEEVFLTFHAAAPQPA